MDNRTYGNKPLPFPPEIAHNPKPKPVVSTYRPPLTQSAWNSSQLSTKPFWESSSAIPQQQPQPQQQQQQQRQQEQQQQQHTPPSSPTVSRNWDARSSVPSPLPSPQSSSPLSPSSTSSMTRKQRRSLGSYASKYATRPPLDINSPTSATTSTGFTPATFLAPATTPASAPASAIVTPSPATESGAEQVIISGTISLADLLAPLSPPRPPSPPAQKPLFELDIELIPGVTTLLPVYERDDYISLVKEFANKHQLSIAPEAERMFANKIEQMATELSKLQTRQ